MCLTRLARVPLEVASMIWERMFVSSDVTEENKVARQIIAPIILPMLTQTERTI